MYTNADVTLYNYSKDKETNKVEYNRTILKGVFWDDTKQSNVLKSGLANIESVNVYIPFSVDTNKQYKTPKEYNTTANKSNYFTIVANSQDMIVKGIVDYDINTTDSKSIAESLSYLRNNYDNVMTISIVDEKDYGSENMRHWEIGGK